MSVETVLSRIPRPEDNWWVEIQSAGARWLHFDEGATRMIENLLPAAICRSRPEQLSVAGQLSRGHQFVYLWDVRSTRQWGPEWELAHESTAGRLYRRWLPEDLSSEKQAASTADEFHRGILGALQGHVRSGAESPDFEAGFEFALREGLAAGT